MRFQIILCDFKTWTFLRFDSVAASAEAELRKLGSNLAKESGLEERDVLRILFQQLERQLDKGSAAMDSSQSAQKV